MISPSGAIAFATNCRTAWSSSSVILRGPRGFASAALTAWKKPMSSRLMMSDSFEVSPA
jgi:hypothetical protein